MRVAIASGKGGTGKTLVAVNLAAALRDRVETTLVDCDVEAPNGHLFLAPTFSTRETVAKRVPRVDESVCTQCGACTAACEFNAITLMAGRILVFDELCHGCGRCGLVCPAGAIREMDHPLGEIEFGSSGALRFAHGRLHIGEAMASPIISQLREAVPDTAWTILDAPPGTACSVITTLHDVDVAVLVTEPTPFGLHDLRAAVGVVRALGLPAGVVINRHGVGDDAVDRYCETERLPVLLRIPFDRRIAETGAEAQLLIDALPEWRTAFVDLAERVKELVR